MRSDSQRSWLLGALVSWVFIAGLTMLPQSLLAQSLWSSETVMDKSLYSSPTASNIGDLITIEVRESTQVSDTEQTNTSRDSDQQAFREAPRMRRRPLRTYLA